MLNVYPPALPMIDERPCSFPDFVHMRCESPSPCIYHFLAYLRIRYPFEFDHDMKERRHPSSNPHVIASNRPIHKHLTTTWRKARVYGYALRNPNGVGSRPRLLRKRSYDTVVGRPVSALCVGSHPRLMALL